MATPCSVLSLGPGEKAEVIRDVYKKHAAELAAIEDAQQKLVLLVLGIFGAGASFLASDKAPTTSGSAKLGLTLVVLGILIVGLRQTSHRDRARIAVRRLLVDCEEALGLFDPGVYRAGSTLYTQDAASYTAGLRDFQKRGHWLGEIMWIAALAAVGFLMILWQ